ncbi:MAG: hypothetical protein HY537_02055 [Deltaproteobacteria bacterium]|nr:hypothetical protein [Deltaproteobacteria bacterium]
MAPLHIGTDSIQALAKQGIFEEKKFQHLSEGYHKYQDKLSPSRRKLAASILDYSRALFEREKAALKREQASIDSMESKDPKKAAELQGKLAELQKKAIELYSLEGLIKNVLEGTLTNPSHEFLIEALTNSLLGAPVNLDRVLLGVGLKPDLVATVRQGLQHLENSGIGTYLVHEARQPIREIQDVRKTWNKTLTSALPKASEDDQNWVEIILNEVRRYQRALTDAELAMARNPGENIPVSWRDGIKNYFRSEYAIPEIKKALKDSKERTQAEVTLGKAAENAERQSREEASRKHKVIQETIRELTDPAGAFKDHKIGYDPVLNTIIIAKDSRLDNVLERLRRLGDYRIYIEPENRSNSFRGQEELENWLQEKRFEHGYESVSVAGNERGEHYLPLTDKTAFKVFRHGDGSYHYAFADQDSVRRELDAHEEILRARRREWILAQENYKSALHALKAYSGAIIRLDPNNTSEAKDLTKSYNNMMQALEWVDRGGHITDSSGKTARQNVLDNRALVGVKLKDEEAAIESFVTKVEVIHDIVSTLVTLPAGGPAESLLLKAAWQVKGASAASRFAARALLTTAKAARAYKASTIAAGKSALMFTGLGISADLVGMGLESFIGDGPKLMREKEALYKAGKPWRNPKYGGNPPKVTDVITNPDNPDKAQVAKYHRDLFEYRIEEAMDPDYDGKPNNHPLLEQKINGTVSPAELAWSPVEQFAGNWRFFQGLNLSKAAIPRGGLVTEMALANLWSAFHPLDPTFERVRREEQHRQEAERESTGKTRERTIGEIAGRELLGGAVEGLRFGIAGIPARYLVERMPRGGWKGFGSKSLGMSTFFLVDGATRYGLDSAWSALTGKPVDSPFHFNDPAWRKQLGHSVATGGYIGWSIAKGAQTSSYHQQLKGQLGMPVGKKWTRETSAYRSQTPIQDLMRHQFGNNEGQAQLFLRSITPQEIAGSSREVQNDFFRLIAKQSSTALEEIKKFAETTNRENLKPVVSGLGERIPEIARLTQKAAKDGLTPEEASRVESLRLEQDIALMKITAVVDAMRTAADNAHKRIDRRTNLIGNVLEHGFQPWRTHTGDQRIVEDYAKNGALIHQALIRLNTIENFQRPVIATTAVLSPSSALGSLFLKEHPKALEALKREESRRTKNPTVGERAIGVHEWLENAHIVPHVSGGGSYSAIPEGYAGARAQASKRIVTARSKSQSAEEKSELLDVLRLVDPQAAVETETQEAKP